MRASRHGLIRRIRNSFPALFGAIWFLVGFPFLVAGIVVGISQGVDRKRLEESGRPVDGMVLVKTLGDSSRVTYRFTAASGSVIRKEVTVSPAAWDQLVERGPIRVAYVPEHPATHRVQGQRSDTLLPLIFGIVGALLSAIGGGLLRYGLRKK